MSQSVNPIEWRSLFLKRPVDEPTYSEDIVGPIGRFDERDNIFARMDLVPGTDRYAEYYSHHEEFEAADAFFRDMPPLGSTAAPADAAMLDALFGSIVAMGAQEKGEVGRVKGEEGLGEEGRARHPEPNTQDSTLRSSQKLKSVARHLGADLVGIGPLNPSFVYSHVGRTACGQTWAEEIPLSHPYAVSLGFGMDYGYLRKYAPGFPVILESALAYAKAALVALQLAAYIRGLGYSARAHHLRDYRVLNVPVAIDAGLGELGRMGILITREFGTSVRLSTVTTDMPLAVDPPIDLGVQAFCEKCSLCAMACPSGAIPRGEKIAVNGVKRWKLSAGRCYHYWRTCGSDCALCIVACPWSKPDAETAPLRPTRPEPDLDPHTLAEVARLRATLPAWLRKG